MLRFLRGTALAVAGMMVAVLLVAACDDGGSGDGTTPAPEESPQADTPTSEPGTPPELSLSSVNVRADWVFNGQHAPLFLAIDKGFFAEEGLEVELNEGAGAAPTLQSLAGGNEDFVYSDQTTMMQLVGQGAPLLSVCNITATNPEAYYALPGTTLDTPKDLEGKRLGEQAGLDVIIREVMFEVNDVDESKIDIVSAAAQGLDAALLNGQIDVSTGFGNDSWVALKAQLDEPPPRLYVADWGVNPVSRGIITTQEMVNDHADTVAALVRGIIRGYEYARDNPEEAAEAITSRFPEQEPDIVLEQTAETLKLVGFGNLCVNEEARWQETQDLLLRADLLENPQDDVSVLYTNEFVP